MEIKELISAIAASNLANGCVVQPPASKEQIIYFEQLIGCELPQDFHDFYSCCNGFATREDLFNMTSLGEIISQRQDFGDGWFCFAEYMTYCDSWAVQITGRDSYAIYSSKLPRTVLTTSLTEYLERFLKGNVSGAGGLYDLEAGASPE